MRRYTVTVAGQARAVEVEEVEGGYRVSVDGREHQLVLLRAAGSALSWLEGTRVVDAVVDGVSSKRTVSTVALGEVVLPVEVADARMAGPTPVGRAPAAAQGPVSVKAPIPGRVARVLVKVGAEVAAGAGLVVLEAMKMENEIRAPRAGSVAEIRCAEGATVESGQALVILA